MFRTLKNVSQCTSLMLLVALTAEPCSMAFPRKLWAKKPGATSKLFAFERNGKVGFIDAAGKVIIKPTIDAHVEQVGDFFDGLARVGVEGYVDQRGRWVIKGEFSGIDDFSTGVAKVIVKDSTKQYGARGVLIDMTGKSVADVPAFSTLEFTEGLAVFEAEGKPGVRKLEPGNFTYLDYPGLQGFLDRSGSVAIGPTFAEVGPFRGGLARATLDGYCHRVMWDGTWEGTATTGYPTSCGGAPAGAVSPCKVGFINHQGGFAIEPRFESARDFQEGFAAVRIGELWGFIDTTGTLVIPPRYERTESFREGLAAVKIEGKWGFIDRSGNLAIPAEFEAVDSFSDSLAVVYSRSGQPKFIDKTGKTKIAGSFREATPFVHGLAAVVLSERHVAYINLAGKTVFDYYRSSRP